MTENLPQHVAIVMDGNGRWAEQRHLPRIAGHKAGLDALHGVVKACIHLKIPVLSLFAFSSENWQRPADEVTGLMQLLELTLANDVKDLHKQHVRVRFIGNCQAFDEKLQQQVQAAEQLTKDNQGLELVVALNYGGRWDILQATKQLAKAVKQGRLDIEDIDAECFHRHLSTADLPEIDLLIRTSGEQRLSNYYLWQVAYTELFFAEAYWPDFNEDTLNRAIAYYQSRQRRFGKTQWL